MKLHLTHLQIRAARALLDWSQEDLAAATNLSVATIRKLESGEISPRGTTSESIRVTLEHAGIEFTPSSGLRLRGNNIIMIAGNDSFLQLLEDVRQTILLKKSEVLFLYGDHAADTEEETAITNELRLIGAKWRFILEEGNTFLRYPIDEYRWLPKKYFKRNLQLIYGDKVAMSCNVDTRINTTTEIAVIESPALAASNTNLFNFMWDNCRKPSHTTAAKVYV